MNGSDYFVYDVRSEVTLPADVTIRIDGQVEDIGPGEVASRLHRVDYFEPFSDLRWIVSWTDHAGGRWLRTSRGEVRRAAFKP